MVIDQPSVNFILDLTEKAELDIEKFELSLKILEAYFEFSEPLENVNEIEQLIDIGKNYYLKQKDSNVETLIQFYIIDAELKLTQWNRKQAIKNIKQIKPLLDKVDDKIYRAYYFKLKARQSILKQLHEKATILLKNALNILESIPGGILKNKRLYADLKVSCFIEYREIGEFEYAFQFYFEVVRFCKKHNIYYSLAYASKSCALLCASTNCTSYYEEAKKILLDISMKTKSKFVKESLVHVELLDIELKYYTDKLTYFKLIEQALNEHKNTMLYPTIKYHKGIYLIYKIDLAFYKRKKEEVLDYCNQLNSLLHNCESAFYFNLFLGLTKLCILDEQYLKAISEMPAYNNYNINYSIDNLFELLIKFTKTRRICNRIEIYNLIINYYKKGSLTKMHFKIFTECVTELQNVCTDTSKFQVAHLATKQLAQKEIQKKDSLLASQKKLIKFFKEFSYSAAHDLKAPIQTITGYSKIIKESYNKMSGEEAQDYLDRIIKTGSTMTGFIDELINFNIYSKINQQNLVDVDLRIVINQVKTNLSNEIEQSGCKVKILFERSSVLARKSPLEMLFQNLISNAIKYRRSDVSPKIEISYNDCSIIAVKDNGVGISADMYKKIFKPFFRIPNENVISTGIGLATCKKIVESFGGKIWLESKVGEGSTFYFTLGKR